MQQPKLRFKTDDGDDFPNLEVKRLGDITIPYNVRNKNTLPLEIYSVNNIVGFVPQSEQFDDAGYLRNTDTSIYMIVPPKHFAYNPARIDIGSIGYQYLDHDVQVSSLYEVFKTSDSVDDDFLWMWFHTSYFNHTVKRLQEGGVRLYFYYDKMQETKIGLPSLAEQQKIALLFSELDTLIQSTEKELESYRELKQCMLQKMFPKKGETVPEIRFPEFTGDWEQRKLGDTIPVVTDYVAAGSFADIAANVDYKSEPDYAQLVRTVDLKHNFENNDSIYVDKKAFDYLYRVNLDEESIVLPNIGANIGEVYYIEPSALPYERNVLGPNAIYLKPCKNTKFIYSLFQTVDFQKKLMVSIASSGQPKFNKTELKEITITLPNNDEQKKIGEYFSNLDNLINLQQKEIDGYKELKKGLLQQMFC